MFGLKHKDIVHSVLFMGSVVPLLQWLFATTIICLFFVVKIFLYTEDLRKHNFTMKIFLTTTHQHIPTLVYP